LQALAIWQATLQVTGRRVALRFTLVLFLQELWNRERLSKYSQFQASGATVCEWCPNGRHLLLATLSPRLRVDNGYKIVDYRGQLALREAFKELYQVCWVPSVRRQHWTFLSIDRLVPCAVAAIRLVCSSSVGRQQKHRAE